jgi:hypothetical protein
MILTIVLYYAFDEIKPLIKKTLYGILGINHSATFEQALVPFTLNLDVLFFEFLRA